MSIGIRVGKITVGGGHPITVQSMTNTRTADAQATIAQILELEKAGCEIVRCSVNTSEAAVALKSIKSAISVPLVADIHFDYKLAIQAALNGADKIRINPSNIGSRSAVAELVSVVKDKGLSIRVGVNGGSLEKSFLEKYGFTPEALAESALSNVAMLEKLGFEDIIISAKCSNTKMNVDTYRLLRAKTDYPLHIGVTEAGGGQLALAKSYVGIGSLLLDGIGDTVRVSLSDKPVKEVEAGINLLRVCGIRDNFVDVVSCPTCGRTEIDVIGIAEKIKQNTRNINKKYKIAVMGCVVNGIGEAGNADIGVAGGKTKSAIFKDGKIIKTVDNEDIFDTLFSYVRADCE